MKAVFSYIETLEAMVSQKAAPKETKPAVAAHAIQQDETGGDSDAAEPDSKEAEKNEISR